MTSMEIANLTRDGPRSKRLATLGDWAAPAIAWAAMMVMCLAVIWVLLYTISD